MNDPLTGYGAAVSTLQNASAGLYLGPSKSESYLRGIYQSIEGLNTGSLREAAQVAAGGTNEARIQGWLGPLVKFFGTVGGGMIASEIAERAIDWFKNRNDVEEVSDAAGKAADAIDTTVSESDQGMIHIIQQLLDIVSTLVKVLGSIDRGKFPQEFRDCVQTGSDLIDQAGDMLEGVCADRDDAISQCFSALTEHGKQVCETEQKPLCSAASATSGASGASGAAVSSASSASSAGGFDSSTDTSTSTNGEKDKTAPASAEKLVEKQVEKPAGKPAEKHECEDKPKPEPVECEPTPAPEPEPEECAPEPELEECEPEPEPEDVSEESDLIGKLIKGAIGIGIVVVGVGLLVNFLEQSIPMIEEPPAPEPEPIPEPISVKPLEADLDKVAEPAPKPIPQANYTAAAATNYSAPAPASPIAPAAPEVEEHPAPVVNVHKAGGW
ncbi:hypothetical protein N24_0724 [Corynebacterium suranareeae]|uniref:Uncharacterized protein n=1 Tax=Corynebacterium suranareeae TaxID=2506452 RepID=A0A160PNM3_9CORY|nr:hypothetical protein [Corynebacterium suranareeae]BAU94986.1 hypothetical protein N24_0724 [Corynebacterium suranareeae]